MSNRPALLGNARGVCGLRKVGKHGEEIKEVKITNYICISLVFMW